jgi:hypothetical protein
MPGDIVSREDLERELREIEAHARGQMEGVFGPASLTWRVHREAVIFLGAGRALLLQLAHPYVLRRRRAFMIRRSRVFWWRISCDARRARLFRYLLMVRAS